MRAFSDLPPPPPLLLLTCVIYSRKRPKCLWATSFLIDLFFSPQLLIDAELDEDVRTNNVCGTYKSLPLKRVRATSAPWFCPPGVLPAEPRVRGSLHRPASPHPLCAAPRMWSLLSLSLPLCAAPPLPPCCAWPLPRSYAANTNPRTGEWRGRGRRTGVLAVDPNSVAAASVAERAPCACVAPAEDPDLLHWSVCPQGGVEEDHQH